jgi:hypothetical protein
MARNAKQIIQKSIEDINDGKWICGDLCTVNDQGKVMGCAIGLVSLNGGYTETYSKYMYNPITRNDELVSFNIALYPYDEDEAKGTKRKQIRAATFALALSIPTNQVHKMYAKDRKNWQAELKVPFSKTIKHTYYTKKDATEDGWIYAGDIKEYGYDPLYTAQSAIVHYNDGALRGFGAPKAADAAKWFKQALKRLEKLETATPVADLETALAASAK